MLSQNLAWTSSLESLFCLLELTQSLPYFHWSAGPTLTAQAFRFWGSFLPSPVVGILGCRDRREVCWGGYLCIWSREEEPLCWDLFVSTTSTEKGYQGFSLLCAFVLPPCGPRCQLKLSVQWSQMRGLGADYFAICLDLLVAYQIRG